ncbi:MAG: hypothetical protein ABL977_04580 [Candidatus Eisenbacteria bacterium]
MNSPRRSAAFAMVLPLLALASGGCLGEPKLEERWTRLDIQGASLASGQAVTAGSTVPVIMSTDITYRRILTGFAVAELRASTTFTPGALRMRPDADRLQMANDIDQLLATSVSMGRMTRAVTGWDHLIQHIDFTFTGMVPGATITDSTGTGPVAGLFLVCYLGSGVRMELPSGADSIVVTPFPSNEYQVLPVGLPLTVTP